MSGIRTDRVPEVRDDLGVVRSGLLPVPGRVDAREVRNARKCRAERPLRGSLKAGWVFGTISATGSSTQRNRHVGLCRQINLARAISDES